MIAADPMAPMPAKAPARTGIVGTQNRQKGRTTTDLMRFCPGTGKDDKMFLGGTAIDHCLAVG